MPETQKPWWTLPIRVARRDYVGEYARHASLDMEEDAREVVEDFHANVEWVMANLACSPGNGEIVLFDTPKFAKLPELGKADVLRDYLPYARKRGLKVLAYINLHWYGYDFAEQHPGWEQMLADGVAYGRRHPLYGVGTTMCINGPWRDFAFDMIAEAAKTGIDGAFLDGPVIFPGACYCDVCRGQFKQAAGADAPTEEDWRSETWRNWIEFREDSMANFLRDARSAIRAINPEACIYLNGGTFAANAWQVARDIQRLADCQDINGAEEFFHPTHHEHWALSSALLGKFLAARNRVAQVFTHHALGSWHYVPLPVNEMKLALAQTLASGATTWFAVWDRSVQLSRDEALAGLEPNAFAEANDKYFSGAKCAARIAMVVSSASNHWYLSQRKELYVATGSGVEQALIADLAQTAVEAQERKGVCDDLLTSSTMGLFDALTRSHLPVEILWDIDVTPEVLAQYDAVVLGNVACLSAEQKAAIRGFVANGGGLFADFEAGMYDQRGDRCDDPEWLAMLGIEKVDGMFAPSRAEDYVVVVDRAAPLADYQVDQFLPRPVNVLQVRARAGASAPAVVAVPLGKPYMAPQGNTDFAGLVLSGHGKGRVAYSPGAVCAAFKDIGMLQHQNLIAAMVRWVMNDRHPLAVTAPQSVYVEWRKHDAPARDLLHLVNNSTDMHRPIGDFIPVHDITIELRRDRVGRVHSLRQGDLPFEFADGKVTATLPVLEQYDVVVIE